MNVLSVHQPHAALLVRGVRRIETRPWQTRYRGLLAIHAARREPSAVRALAQSEPWRSLLAAAGLVFPLTWLVWAVLAGRAFGVAAGFATLLLAPATGWYAMRFQERYERLFDEAVAYLRVKWRSRGVAALRDERAALHAEVSELANPAGEEEKP